LETWKSAQEGFEELYPEQLQNEEKPLRLCDLKKIQAVVRLFPG